MTYKPLPIKKFKRYVQEVGWVLSKGSVDWNLYNDKGDFICSIIISHGKERNRKLQHLA